MGYVMWLLGVALGELQCTQEPGFGFHCNNAYGTETLTVSWSLQYVLVGMVCSHSFAFDASQLPLSSMRALTIDKCHPESAIKYAERDIWSIELSGDVSELQSSTFSEQLNLRFLSIKDTAYMTTLPAEIFNGLSKLKTLKLAGNNFMKLHPETFDGLTNLLHLRIQNKLLSLPPEIFGRLNTLETLILTGNNFADLHPETFDGLANLRHPRIQNKLFTLPAEIFGRPNTLEALNLAGNNFTELYPETFNGLTNLRHLSLQNNLLTLPADIFGRLNTLETLNLACNNFTELHPETFDGLTNLRHLSIQNNLLTLPADIFGRLSKLETLNLAGNNFTELHPETFDGLTNLRHLRIQNNLFTLPAEIFGRLSKLETLVLTGNNFTELHHETFDGLTNLRHLFIQDNKLLTLPSKIFNVLSKLETLILTGNNFTGLYPETFGGLRNITTFAFSVNISLHLSHNGTINICGNQTTGNLTEHIPDIFKCVKRLRKSRIKIRALPKDVPDVSCRRVFPHQVPGMVCVCPREYDCDYIPIKYMFKTSSLRDLKLTGRWSLSSYFFTDWSQLHYLDIGSNNLAQFPAYMLQNLGNLTMLRLRNNHLKTIGEDDFRGLSALKKLVLGSNQLTVLPPGVFRDLASLTALELDFNRLESLSQTIFQNLTRLKWLDLSYNKLEILPNGVFEATNLTGLFLGSNRLRNVSTATFRGLQNLEQFTLVKNEQLGMSDSLIKFVKDRMVDHGRLQLTTTDCKTWTTCDENSLCRCPGTKKYCNHPRKFCSHLVVPDGATRTTLVTLHEEDILAIRAQSNGYQYCVAGNTHGTERGTLPGMAVASCERTDYCNPHGTESKLSGSTGVLSGSTSKHLCIREENIQGDYTNGTSICIANGGTLECMDGELCTESGCRAPVTDDVRLFEYSLYNGYPP